MKPRILLVDDAPHMLRLLGRILVAALDGQAEVHATADGGAAIAALCAQAFDLVITDLRMPGASGLEVLREARRQEPAPEVLLLTAFAGDEVLREAMRLGASACVRKPFDPDALAALVRGALDRAADNRVPGSTANLPGSPAAETRRGSLPSSSSEVCHGRE